MRDELFRPETIENFSLEGRAAIDTLKTFIATIDTALLDERALELAGLPQDDIDEGIADICRELAKWFAEDGRVSGRVSTGRPPPYRHRISAPYVVPMLDYPAPT